MPLGVARPATAVPDSTARVHGHDTQRTVPDPTGDVQVSESYLSATALYPAEDIDLISTAFSRSPRRKRVTVTAQLEHLDLPSQNGEGTDYQDVEFFVKLHGGRSIYLETKVNSTLKLRNCVIAVGSQHKRCSTKHPRGLRLRADFGQNTVSLVIPYHDGARRRIGPSSVNTYAMTPGIGDDSGNEYGWVYDLGTKGRN
jgi:hypothetical protein